MLSIIIILSIALAIFLGYRTKINYRSFLYCICLHHRMFRYGIKAKADHWFLAYKYHVCYLICFIIL